MVVHEIRASEPLWVLSKQTLNEDNELDRVGDVQTLEYVQDALDGAEFECTCGEGFDSASAAAEHLQTIQESSSGESIRPR